MIGRLDIRVNAAHPNFPVAPVYVFANAPCAPRVTGVPSAVGEWAITAVSIALTLPDNSVQTIPLTNVDGEWIGVLPACATTGDVTGGLQVVASGTDESGAAVTGYCLGVGDYHVMNRDSVVLVGGVRHNLRYVESEPSAPATGDVTYIDGALKWWNGTAWTSFATGVSSVNNVSPVDGNVALTAIDVPVSSASGAESVAAALDSLDEKVDETALLRKYYPIGDVTSLSQITTEGLTFAVDEYLGGARMTQASAATGDVVIPYEVKIGGVTYPVVAIGDMDSVLSGFRGNPNVTSVVAPITVTQVNNPAFEDCRALVSVALPGVTFVDYDAFMNDVSLMSVDLPNVSSMTESAFVSCTALRTVRLPSIGSLPINTFASCTSLDLVDLGTNPRAIALGETVFDSVPITCRILLPMGAYTADWQALKAAGYDVRCYADAASLAAVATSGSYSDLTGTPTIPAAQVQSNWTEADATSKAYIQNKPTLATVATSGSYNDLTNKPTIPTVPTNVSDFVNDAGYVTRYAQNAITLPAGTTSLTLTDREANRYDITALTNETVAVTMPTITSGKAADVVVVFVVGADVPTFDWDDTTNKFIANDNDWATLTANKINVISFTSNGAANEWTVGRVTEA